MKHFCFVAFLVSISVASVFAQGALPPDQLPPDQFPPPQYDLAPMDDWLEYTPPQLATWDGSLELGVNGSEGNAQSFSMRTGGDLKRETEDYLWEMDFAYAKTKAQSIETQHYALFNSKLEWLFDDSPWTWFTRLGAEYDEFKAFNLRLFANTGLGYQFIDTEITTLKGRFGGGVSREFGGPDDYWSPEATLGMDFERQLSRRQKFKAIMDYFPNVSDFSDYRLVTDLGWLLTLDDEANLSLKLSLIDRYDSTPHGLKPNDVNYAILLLWKL